MSWLECSSNSECWSSTAQPDERWDGLGPHGLACSLAWAAEALSAHESSPGAVRTGAPRKRCSRMSAGDAQTAHAHFRSAACRWSLQKICLHKCEAELLSASACGGSAVGSGSLRKRGLGMIAADDLSAHALQNCWRRLPVTEALSVRDRQKRWLRERPEIR